MDEFLVKFGLATVAAGITQAIIVSLDKSVPFWIVWIIWLIIAFGGVLLLEEGDWN